jgi:hypothetical protein
VEIQASNCETAGKKERFYTEKTDRKTVVQVYD